MSREVLRRAASRGVRLMGMLADEFSLTHDRDGTEVVLRYRL